MNKLTRSETTAPPADVWIVEDNGAFQRALLDLVHTDARLTCSLVTGRCEDAIDALRRGLRPALVLLDLGLPEMGGQEGLRRMRNIVPDLLVLVITIESDDEAVFHALEAGAAGYLLKPATGAQLLEGMHSTLDGGSPISPVIARKLLTAFNRLRTPSPDYKLTARETQILECLVEAQTLQQIATQLGLSRHTVDTHVRRIYEKLQVRSRAGAVAKATRR